ncbi:hypothetical protein MKEN_00883800 [Mycena kentingensis (nom. inval.)]|nr:hypothetical protein MKEN_00883800 [Mycena kentingensis (nom. inval.)]
MQYTSSSHPPPQQTLPMPPSYPHTVNDADDTTHHCRVCDGPCSCFNTTDHVPHHRSFPLKIKLVVPPSLRPQPQMTSASVQRGGPSRTQFPVVPKRRGRPPKAVVAARQLALKSGKPFYSRPPASKKAVARLKGKTTIGKKPSVAKRKRVVDYTDSSSELSDIDDSYQHNGTASLPTFVPASVLSSSESEIASSSGFDSDSSMDADDGPSHHKSRVRRELFDEDDPQPRRNSRESWTVHSRQRSVGPNDVEMDVDSDATEDEEEEEQEAEEDDDDDEADVLRAGSGYMGLGTGWSDDEESSFDADLFFANLSDDDDGSDADDDHPRQPDEHDERAEDGDQSDLDSLSASDSTALTEMLPQMRDYLPFELTHDWDGQLVFSPEDRGLLDVDFSSLVATSASPSQESDRGGDTTEDEGEFEGDTTDEELVGENHLPNERAMRMFVLPFSVSSINPLSTLSPAARRIPRHRRHLGLQDNLKPVDILSGRAFDVPDNDYEQDVPAPTVSSNGKGPRTGAFTPNDTITAIIDDSHSDVPSPHPHVRRRRRKPYRAIAQSNPPSRQQSLPPIPQPSFQLLSSSSELTTSPELHPQTMDLDDVLDVAFLDSEEDQPSEELSASPTESSRRHLNLSRWGWSSDTPTADYRKVLKSSPLSTLWQDKDRARDGDRTPTNSKPPPFQPPPTKSRKQPRKQKQKNLLGYERPPNLQHHARAHHPNLKNRSASQRSHFNASPSGSA